MVMDKTYFLSKFVNNPSVKENISFLTLYPINYQVLPNKDIFSGYIFNNPVLLDTVPACERKEQVLIRI